MELQKISEVMDKFESQFEDLDVKTSVSVNISANAHSCEFGKYLSIEIVQNLNTFGVRTEETNLT